MKIQIVASAGQGTKLISTLIGKILSSYGMYAYVYTLYGPNMRKGIVSSFIVTDCKLIEEPFFEKSDVLFEFAQADESLPSFKKIDMNVLNKIAESKLNDKSMVNFVLLGYLLKLLKLELKTDKIKEFVSENISDKWKIAVKEGYEMKA